MKGTKEPVRLREKELANGDKSLYLDIYHNGRRKYEFLKLYIVKETNKIEREMNRKTMELANTIKAQRTIEIQSREYGLRADRTETPFFEYVDHLRTMVEYRNGTLWASVRKTVLTFCKDKDITFKAIDTVFVKGYRAFLDKSKLSSGSKHIYFAVFKAMLNRAVKDDILTTSPAKNIEGFKPSDARRVYLTADELAKLSRTECVDEGIRNGFLFSCLTGLRLSDVQSLTWGDVTEEGGYTRITFRQKKTKWQEYLDINRQAVRLMGRRRKPTEMIFNLNHGYSYINTILGEWAKRAKIHKHVTFHVARHTFATMMLANGVDIYTVSKLVGHRDIKTTQIYAKVMDKDKRRAVDTIPDGLIGS